ncbi:hypothetical protein CR513_00135, partial [Mucuna pruriens]
FFLPFELSFQVLARINDNTYKLDLPTTYGEDFDSRTNPFEEGENDRDPTNKVKDNLRDIGGPMTRLKTQIMKQSLSSLSLGITESLKQNDYKMSYQIGVVAGDTSSFVSLCAKTELSQIPKLEQMGNNDRTLKDLATLDVVYQPWCIQYP